jgi:hypothetical protein
MALRPRTQPTHSFAHSACAPLDLPPHPTLPLAARFCLRLPAGDPPCAHPVAVLALPHARLAVGPHARLAAGPRARPLTSSSPGCRHLVPPSMLPSPGHRCLGPSSGRCLLRSLMLGPHDANAQPPSALLPTPASAVPASGQRLYSSLRPALCSHARPLPLVTGASMSPPAPIF